MAAAVDKHNHAHSKTRAWFCTTGLPSDILVHVGDITFHLHKFPMMSKSKKLHVLITDRENNGDREVGKKEEEIEEEDELQISFQDFPGGPEVFEAAAKFCYGVKLDITACNVVPLRCAAEYLEMTDVVAGDDNLAQRADRYLRHSVFPNLRESVIALKSCEDLLPLAEELGLVQLCIDSIASAATAAADTSAPTLFGWPIIEDKHRSRSPPPAIWNGIEVRRKSGDPRSSSAAPALDSWMEDLMTVTLPIYKRVIEAMKKSELSSEIVESCLICYAERSIPGISRSSRRKHSSAPMASEAEQCELLETVISNLPPASSNHNNKNKKTGTRLLFGLLRTANILRASEEAKTALEKKIATQLEQAALDDLLVPSYSYLVDTLYDVDCVHRIVNFFKLHHDLLVEEQHRDLDEEDDRMMMVGKLVDGFLAEIASDVNLGADKFCKLAATMPANARLYDDGLYRAVDLYLKAHPSLAEEERERVCAVMDCGKLTPEACTHAAQNERLPLRAIVQVLFFEQLQLRHAIADSILLSHHNQQPQPLPDSEQAEDGQQQQQKRMWRAAVRENQVLRLDMDGMRSRVQELEQECLTMKKALVKMDLGAAGDGGRCRRQKTAPLSRRWGCKLKTQVCDSHDRTVVESRRIRNAQPPSASPTL